MNVAKDPASVHATVIAQSLFQGVVMSLDEKVPDVPLAQLIDREWAFTRGWPAHQYPDQEGRKGEVLTAAATQLKHAVSKHYCSLVRSANKEAAAGAHVDSAALLADLHYLVYPPVLEPAALRTAILARVAERDEWDMVLQGMTPGEAWEGFVGSQSTADFWALAQEQGATSFAGASRRYAEQMPGMTEEWSALTGEHMVRIAELLARYLDQNLGPIAGA